MRRYSRCKNAKKLGFRGESQPRGFFRSRSSADVEVRRSLAGITVAAEREFAGAAPAGGERRGAARGPRRWWWQGAGRRSRVRRLGAAMACGGAGHRSRGRRRRGALGAGRRGRRRTGPRGPRVGRAGLGRRRRSGPAPGTGGSGWLEAAGSGHVRLARTLSGGGGEGFF